MGIRSKAKKIRQLLPIVGAGGNRGPAPEPSVERTAAPRAVAAPVAPPVPDTPRGNADPADFIGTMVKDNAIVLFMKGSPAMPQCGFSANASAILKTYGHGLAHVDVLMDPEVRQGVKEFSNWPTIPQVYVGGEFLGGSDILVQMHENGELGALIEAAAKA
jgi:monothiol glutaredoxin